MILFELHGWSWLWHTLCLQPCGFLGCSVSMLDRRCSKGGTSSSSCALQPDWGIYSLENLNCEFHIMVGDGPIPHMLCSMKANGCHVWFEQNVHSHNIHVWYIYLHVVDF